MGGFDQMSLKAQDIDFSKNNWESSKDFVYVRSKVTNRGMKGKKSWWK
jgi:hypothetical protein